MMAFFRILLATLFASLAVYTLMVGASHGWNLVPPFLAEIRAMSWQGQFNLDFAMFLLLSGLWCAWRNGFSPAGWGLALVAATGGMLFLAAYLLYLSVATGGDVKAMMLGARRAQA
jgi:uncharacterized membrane protein YozB (DUF420 family)